MSGASGGECAAVTVEAPPARRSSGSAQFGWLWLSNLFFFGSTWMLTLVFGWLIYQHSHSPALLGLYGVLRMTPLLLGPIAGLVVDRVHRVGFLLLLSGWACAAMAAVATCVSLGVTPVWLFLVGGLAIGMAQSPAQPARSALVMEYVGRSRLSRANALNMLSVNITQVAGPALGGVLLGAIGAPAALWLSAGLYFAALASLIPLRRTGRVQRTGPSRSLRAELREGFRIVMGIPETAGLFLITIFANLLLWPVYEAFMPVFAADRLHLGPNGLALLLGCAGIGSLIGSLVIARLGDFRGKGAVFVFGTVAWTLAWSAFAMSRLPLLSLVLMFLAGLIGATFMVLQATLLLLVVPPTAHGRAFGLLQLAIGAQPLGSLALGLLADRFGVGATVAVSSALLAVIVLAITVYRPALARYR